MCWLLLLWLLAVLMVWYLPTVSGLLLLAGTLVWLTLPKKKDETEEEGR